MNLKVWLRTFTSAISCAIFGMWQATHSFPALRFLKFAGQCFHQKRKTLRNNLAGIYGKDAMAGWPQAGKRAEELTLKEFAELYRRLVPS